MTAGRRRDPGAAVLGALLLGLLTAPWVYVTLFGALTAFPSPFAVVVTPLLIAATLDLGLEAFARLRGPRWVRRVGAVVSVTVVLASLWVLSKFTLLTQGERVGLFATVWLGASLSWLVISLPLGAVGPEALLRSRLTSSARQWSALTTALVLLALLSALSWYYLTTPAHFIGGHSSKDAIG